MGQVTKQIIGSFEDIGKDVVRQAVNVPKDVAQKALESMGVSSQKGQQGTQTPASSVKPQQEGAVGQLDVLKDQKAKQAIARAALAELAGKHKAYKEPTVQERLEKEKQEKVEQEKQKAAVSGRMAPLPAMSVKPKRGNLYGIKQKASTEMSKNVRQD